MADAKTVLEFAKKNGAKLLDLRFTDLPGLWQHVSYPINQLSADSFEEGFGMDGSSIRGWAAINESDMLLIPDPSTHMMDPFTEVPTLSLLDGLRAVRLKLWDEKAGRLVTFAEAARSSHGALA